MEHQILAGDLVGFGEVVYLHVGSHRLVGCRLNDPDVPYHRSLVVSGLDKTILLEQMLHQGYHSIREFKLVTIVLHLVLHVVAGVWLEDQVPYGRQSDWLVFPDELQVGAYLPGILHHLSLLLFLFLLLQILLLHFFQPPLINFLKVQDVILVQLEIL